MVRTLGVIPARGKSKRVTRKNLRPLNGHALIWYTIEAAKQATKLTDWVVSTEDLEIANYALSCGAYVVNRPEYLAGDDTTSGTVVRHALNWMEVDRAPYDMVVLLHPTSPIRDPNHIDEAVEKLWASELDTLASVCLLPQKNHRNIGSLLGDTVYLEPIDDFCVMNASIYAMKRAWFLKHNRHTDDLISVPLVMDRFHSLDVDEEVDLAIAGVYLGSNFGL